MRVDQMSTSGRRLILNNWLDMYSRIEGTDKNGVVRQCTTSFPSFGDRMRTNLQKVGVDKSFELSMKGLFMGDQAITPQYRGRRR